MLTLCRRRTHHCGQKDRYYRRCKCGVLVYVPIPDVLASLLKGTKPVAGYYFLRGQSTRMETCTDLWRRDLAHIFREAEIQNGHPHRFRDTFAR